jgi:hypothetical protein
MPMAKSKNVSVRQAHPPGWITQAMITREPVQLLDRDWQWNRKLQLFRKVRDVRKNGNQHGVGIRSRNLDELKVTQADHKTSTRGSLPK